MLREWVVGRLTNYAPMTNLIGDRLTLGSSLTEIPGIKPFAIYRVGTSTADLRGDGTTRVMTTPIQLYFHDEPGDYGKIDNMLRFTRAVLEGGSSREHGIIACEWIEDSEDLRDDEFHTNLRWARYQVIHEEQHEG